MEMIRNDLGEFSRLMKGAWLSMGKEITDDAISLMFEVLARYNVDDIRRAVGAYLSNPDKKYPPKAADIAEALGGNSDEHAIRAWSKVDAAVRTVGPWQSICFDDPLINSAVATIGGWIKLSELDNREYEFVKHEFRRLYKALCQRESVPNSWPRKLTGLAEMNNGDSGNKYLTLYGDKEAAKMVYSGGSDFDSVVHDAPTAMIDRTPHKTTEQLVSGREIE